MLISAPATLLGDFGMTEIEQHDVASRLASQTLLSQSELADALFLLQPNDRAKVVEFMMAAGTDPSKIGRAMEDVMRRERGDSGHSTLMLALLAASSAASLYHGYKRNNSLGWGLAWGALGALFPIITPVVAVAQGYGKEK